MSIFQRAQRTQAKLRLAIDGPSGSGKTYSALLIAKGLAGGDLSKVALIDTERGSGSLYADLGPYAVAEMDPPYSPKKFMGALDAAVDEGFAVIVIDSLSHAWAGEGGVLDYVDNVAKTQTRGNSFTAWKAGTKVQNELVDHILSMPCHVIATMRTKTEWVIEENEKGKKVPRKIGMAVKQRDDVEYEFTTYLNMSREEHIATASKDRTGIFDGRFVVPSEEMGQEFLTWLGSAAPEPPKRQTIRDEQAEQAPAVSGNHEPAQSGEPNGHITRTQAQHLHEMLIAKGAESSWFLREMHEKGVGDGEHLTSLPAQHLERYHEFIGKLVDPAPPQPQEADPADQEFLDATAGNGKRQEPDESKPRKKGTITAPMLTRLGAQCADLENLGVGREEWRRVMYEKEGVISRTELTKAAATRMIDLLQRWITDVGTGVAAPGGRAA